MNALPPQGVTGNSVQKLDFSYPAAGVRGRLLPMPSGVRLYRYLQMKQHVSKSFVDQMGNLKKS